MQQETLGPTGGPTLWWVWGDLRQALSRLEQGQHDMRREHLYLAKRLEQRLEGKKKGRWAWLAHIPWDRIVVFLAGALGALGWIKPQWIKLLTGS